MRCYSHLSDDEREQIGLAKAVGHSIGAIAKAIGRPKSTVSRELSRNKLPSGRYSPLRVTARRAGIGWASVHSNNSAIHRRRRRRVNCNRAVLPNYVIAKKL